MSCVDTQWYGDLSDVERDPRMLELAIRQRKAASEFSSKQAQEYVRLALNIRKELRRESATQP